MRVLWPSPDEVDPREPALERLFEEQGLGVERFLVFLGFDPVVGAVGVQLPGVHRVRKLEVEESADLLAVARLAQGEELLHAPVEVALHQVG